MDNLKFNQMEKMTIGEIVTKHPVLVKVFMDFHVDFCCGGDRNVMDAIKRDTDEVEALRVAADQALEASRSFSVDGEKMTLEEFTSEQLIERIVGSHHKYLKETLPRISELLFKILSVHGDNHPEIFEVHQVFGGLKTELESHLIKEEKQLFPKLIKGDKNCKALIETLEAEHIGAGDALHKLTELTDHFSLPPDACTSYELTYTLLKEFVSDMYVHVHTENNVLFKRFQ